MARHGRPCTPPGVGIACLPLDIAPSRQSYIVSICRVASAADRRRGAAAAGRPAATVR
eukprot:SAG31_NODE_34817_length_329_cov_0.534783_1_plen_57_part_10